MSHIVVYQSGDGSAGYEPCDSIDKAINVAERLRNVDGIESPRIFRMEEIHIDFRPYYRVEVTAADAATAPEVAPGAEEDLTNLPAPPTAEAIAAAEAETGEAVAVETTWEEPHAAAPEESHVAADEGTETAAEDADAESMPVAEEAAPAAAPESDTAEDSGEGNDPMINVRRGLFGR